VTYQPAPDSVTEQLDHTAPGDDPRVPLVVCDDCGCLVIPNATLLARHDRVCPGHIKPRPLTDLARRILGIKP
jgi:hypothetical protein